MNNVISRNGALFCFCEEELKAKVPRDEIYSFPYTDMSGGISYTEAKPMCKKYYNYMTGMGLVLQESFNYLIVGLSFVVRSIILIIVDKIRFVSLTKETGFAMLAVFWITFINYGVIYLLASWDLRSDSDGWWSHMFDGLYPDFNALWFNDVGVLVTAIMVSNMYWPPLEFFMFWGIRLLYRMWD